MSREDKCKSLQLDGNCNFIPTPNLIQMTNYPHKPLLFYLRDHELYYTSFYGPRCNESAIFIDYQEWYNYVEISFYQYLKIIKAYHVLVQDVNNHPVLIVTPTGYIESF